jgi:hypothetical protein
LQLFGFDAVWNKDLVSVLIFTIDQVAGLPVVIAPVNRCILAKKWLKMAFFL